MKIFKIILNTILFLLVVLGIFVVFSFVPIPGNYRIFTVQSGSMEPAIHTGSLIFSKPLKEYSPGDIVTRKTSDPKTTVTHRIISKEEVDGEISFKTKGDANNSEDVGKTSPEDIVGKVLLSVPWLGYPVSYARTSQGVILLIVIPAVIIIYDELNKIKKEIRKKINSKKNKKENLENEKENEEIKPIKKT